MNGHGNTNQVANASSLPHIVNIAGNLNGTPRKPRPASGGDAKKKISTPRPLGKGMLSVLQYP